MFNEINSLILKILVRINKYIYLLLLRYTILNIECKSVSSNVIASIPADIKLLIKLNYMSLFNNLNKWHNGGCPVQFFLIENIVKNQKDCTLVTNNVIPEQQNITVMHIITVT